MGTLPNPASFEPNTGPVDFEAMHFTILIDAYHNRVFSLPGRWKFTSIFTQTVNTLEGWNDAFHNLCSHFPADVEKTGSLF